MGIPGLLFLSHTPTDLAIPRLQKRVIEGSKVQGLGLSAGWSLLEPLGVTGPDCSLEDDGPAAWADDRLSAKALSHVKNQPWTSADDR